MKKFFPALVLFCTFAVPAFGWNCSDPLASRVPVPAGTSGSFGNGDGQLFLGTGSEGTKGQLYQCQVPKTPTPPSNPGQNQTQTQSQNQTASGGSATATGGSSVSSSASSSTLKNSGNSSNTNVNTANGGAGGTASSNASASNNGNGSNNSSYNSQTKVEAAAATAFSNASPTASCVVGYSAGGQLIGGGLSLSGGKIDKNCAILETARSAAAYANRLTYCKVYITDKWAKKAGVTLEDCLQRDVVAVPAPPVTVAPEPQVDVIVVPPSVPVAEAPPSRLTFRTVGTCFVPYGKPTNVCYRILDDAALVLQSNPNAKILLTGPVESATVVPYLRKRVDISRIELKLADDENSTLTIQTEIWEQ